VGLIGGIGSGKSLIARLLAERGAAIVSGDALGHEALRQPALRARVVERWGESLLNEGGEIDRRRLAEVVFGEPRGRQALEAIVHPYIKRRLREEVDRALARPEVRLVVVDAAVMLEAGWNSLCDRLIYIDVPRPLRLQRLRDQRGWHEKEVAARERAQMPLNEKAARANSTVDNSGSPEDIARQIDALLRRWGLDPSASPIVSAETRSVHER